MTTRAQRLEKIYNLMQPGKIRISSKAVSDEEIRNFDPEACQDTALMSRAHIIAVMGPL
jgi:hypothetical protein